MLLRDETAERFPYYGVTPSDGHLPDRITHSNKVSQGRDRTKLISFVSTTTIPASYGHLRATLSMGSAAIPFFVERLPSYAIAVSYDVCQSFG